MVAAVGTLSLGRLADYRQPTANRRYTRQLGALLGRAQLAG